MLKKINLIIIFAALLFARSVYSESYKFRSEFVKITPEAKGYLSKDCPYPDQPYEISKYELTNTEYVEFLNSVAKYGDPYNLYSKIQGEHFWGGIYKNEKNNEYFFQVKHGYENLPVTFISWFDAIRYVNWLNYGKPITGKSELGTTEGNETKGAYNTSALLNGKKIASRNSSATYFLPSCGEWLYAGFYDPLNKKISRYSGGDSSPKAGPPDVQSRSANYYEENWALPYPHLAPVNAYANNPSQLGTLNQSGNVMEWVETDGNMALGGSLFLPSDTITSSYRDLELPSKKLSSFGFRIARKSPINPPLILTAVAEIGEPPRKIDLAVKNNKPTTLSGQWTHITEPGNFSDIETGRGCVEKEYEVSTSEITNQEWADFLNAIATASDINSLYINDMSTGVVGGISRIKIGEKYEFSAKPGYENRPAAYLSWFSIARYANWMHFGKPAGVQKIGTTEGNSSIGAYDTTRINNFLNSEKNKTVEENFLKRNPGAKYFIPSDDEWYKAAYYDPEKTGFYKYWTYPNRSDEIPENDLNAGNGFNFQVESLGEGAPYYVSNTGEFEGTGYYRLNDMGGNVWEWLESWKNLGAEDCWRCDSPKKGLRGGSFNYIEIGLSKKNIDPGTPTNHYFTYGGRLARQVDSAETSWCIPSETRYLIAGSASKVLAQKKLTISVLILLAVVSVFFIFRIWRRRN